MAIEMLFCWRQGIGQPENDVLLDKKDYTKKISRL